MERVRLSYSGWCDWRCGVGDLVSLSPEWAGAFLRDLAGPRLSSWPKRSGEPGPTHPRRQGEAWVPDSAARFRDDKLWMWPRGASSMHPTFPFIRSSRRKPGSRAAWSGGCNPGPGLRRDERDNERVRVRRDWIPACAGNADLRSACCCAISEHALVLRRTRSFAALLRMSAKSQASL